MKIEVLPTSDILRPEYDPTKLKGYASSREADDEYLSIWIDPEHDPDGAPTEDEQ
jgi:hypothetical protein